MKKFKLNFNKKGHNRKLIYSIKTNKINSVGETDYRLNIFANNKYSLNRHLKFNVSISNGIYNNILYNHKKINA